MSAAVRDPAGNQWFIATRLEELWIMRGIDGGEL